MSESKFKALQEDVCYKEPEQIEEEAALDKICPTCIPNPNYFEPEWETTTEPYLNEAVCEYQIKVMINSDADIYHDDTRPLLSSAAVAGEVLAGENENRRSFRRLRDSPYDINVLLKSYIRPAVRKMLGHFGKM